MSDTNIEDFEQLSNKPGNYSVLLIIEIALSAVLAVAFLVVCILSIIHG